MANIIITSRGHNARIAYAGGDYLRAALALSRSFAAAVLVDATEQARPIICLSTESVYTTFM